MARGQALHFRALIQIWGRFILGPLHLLFATRKLSLLLLNPDNKAKLKYWLKQPNQIVSYWTGRWWQGKQSHPSEDVTQHRGGVFPPARRNYPNQVWQLLLLRVPSSPQPALGLRVHSQTLGQAPCLVLCSGWYITSPHSHQFMLKLLHEIHVKSSIHIETAKLL